MPFVKVLKNKAYFKRYQVKFRRRREAKTDYYARQRLIVQDKNKYKSPKYRFVVRFTNKDVVCQIFAADLTHDRCIAAAYSHELKRYGIKFGLTNYAAAYCTGLLLARRINAKFGLKYEGNTEIDGTDYLVEADDDGPKPFRAFLDVGLARTTTGARIFGALKGATDGGLNIPHNERRFPGSRKEDGEWTYDPEFHRKYIFGGHVAEYMEYLKEQDENAEEEDDKQYDRQFGNYVKLGVNGEDLEDLYTKAHEQIRADPNRGRDPLELGRFKTRQTPKTETEYPKKYYRRLKIGNAQRKSRIRQKLLARGIKKIGPAQY